MPDNIGNKKYCTPWKQKVLTYDFQNYSSLGKEKHWTKSKMLLVCFKMFAIWNLKEFLLWAKLWILHFWQMMKSKMWKLTVLTNWIIKNLALWRMDFTLEIQHCLAICILTMRDGQTRKQLQGMGNTIYFQSLFTKLVIASDCFTILNTKTVLCDQFTSLDSVSKTRTRYFLNLTLKQCKKCMVQQNM